MSGHATLSPSSAKRWLTCPASVARTKDLPDRPSEAAAWGTAAHMILERSLLQAVDPMDVDLAGLRIEPEDDPAGKGYPIEEHYGAWDLNEMRETARVAYTHVLFAGDVKAETKTDPGSWIGRDDMDGTADITVLNPRHLEIVDLKGGKGVVVEADDPQMRLYGVGELVKHFWDLDSQAWSVPPEAIEVVTTVVQPRAAHALGPVRSVKYTGHELLQWMEQEVEPAAVATDDPNAPAVPSEDACRWCRAKGTCPELAAKSMDAARAVFQPVTAGAAVQERQPLADALVRDAWELTPEQVRFVLDHEKLITGWLSAVREYASEQLRNGHADKVPGYKLVPGRSSRSWSVGETELEAVMLQLKRQDGKKVTHKNLVTESFLSPAQAEKQLKPLLPADSWSVVQEFIKKSTGAPTLAPETDSRPAIPQAKDVFKPIEQNDLPDFLN